VDTMFADRPVADETLNQSAKATSQDPLPVVLKAALAHVERADKAEKNAADHRTSAGLRFKEFKDRVQAARLVRCHGRATAQSTSPNSISARWNATSLSLLVRLPMSEAMTLRRMVRLSLVRLRKRQCEERTSMRPAREPEPVINMTTRLEPSSTPNWPTRYGAHYGMVGPIVNRPGFAEAVSFESRRHGGLLHHGIVAFLGFGWRDVADGLPAAGDC
jgi:hypothetical protein